MDYFTRCKESFKLKIQIDLKKEKDLLIEAFVRFYGEKYRQLITYRFNQIVFIFFYEPEGTQRIVKAFGKKCPAEIKKIAFAYQQKSFVLSFLRKAIDYKDKVIYTSDESIWDNIIIPGVVQNLINEKEPVSILYGMGNSSKRIILLPIIFSSSLDIIHEINHAITRDILAYLEIDRHIVRSASKVGISLDFINSSDEQMTEELFNELASKDIDSIFQSLGGSFANICYPFTFQDVYGSNLSLASDIYTSFAPIINEARISDNKNLFVQTVGQENFDSYVNFINHAFNYKVEDISTLYQQEAHSILTQMKQYQEDNNEDLEARVNSLRQMGYKVTPFSEVVRKRQMK